MNKKDIEIIKDTSKHLLEIVKIYREGHSETTLLNDLFELHCLLKRLGFYSPYWGIDKCCHSIEFFLTVLSNRHNIGESNINPLLDSIEIIALNSLEYGKNQEGGNKK